MHLEEELAGGFLIFRVKGELDLNTAEEFRRRAEDAMYQHRCYSLVLNLRKLDFLDSAGLGAILGRYRQVSQRQGRMVIVAPPTHIQTVLEMSGIRKIIPIFASEQKALAG